MAITAKQVSLSRRWSFQEKLHTFPEKCIENFCFAKVWYGFYKVRCPSFRNPYFLSRSHFNNTMFIGSWEMLAHCLPHGTKKMHCKTVCPVGIIWPVNKQQTSSWAGWDALPRLGEFIDPPPGYNLPSGNGENHKVPPEALFLSAKHPHLPQPFFIRLVLL